jgi:polyhydroxyalkanoate synthesis regulator phasin
MDERANTATKSLRELVEKTLYAGVGAVALTADRVEELVDEIEKRGAMTRDEAQELLGGAYERWRAEGLRLGERATYSLGGVIREVGLVTRREYEELELRLAQLEHRLRLLERTPAGTDGPPARRP